MCQFSSKSKTNCRFDYCTIFFLNIVNYENGLKAEDYMKLKKL